MHSSRHHPRCISAVLIGLAFAACAGETRPRRATPDPDTFARLAEAERAYRHGALGYAEIRDELMQDPVAAAWLTRMFVRELVRVREGRPLGEDQDLLRAAANIENPVEKRAIQEIVVLGKGAVPVLIGELLLNDQAHNREYGIELVGYVGRPAMAAVLEASRSTSPRERRSAARALGVLPREPEALARLHELAQDREFTVRADAARGLRHGEAGAAELLRSMVRDDDDPFVRRTAATALLGHPGRPTAAALIDYLDRCRREVDTRGYEAAQAALVELAAARGPRTIEAWRRWAAALPQ